ncbi:MAG: riboflavin biosynthesis protein RibF [Bacteroidales bacterium]|nr:riboflavin biosynthesis protein RibF [Bacteroidales bacterium]
MAVIATGFFDGVHVGHRLVLETLVQTARERGELSVVVTFWPHPRIVLHDDALSLRLLNTLDEKINLLRGLGVDRVEVLPFTEEFSRTSAADYLRKYVKERFDGTAILLGYDNRIGHDSGTPAQTADIAAELGLDVIRTDKVSSVGIAVSSSKIRKALNAGDVATASAFLCYDYSLEGEVVHGRKVGRTIGFPTANLDLYEKMKLVPAEGVYLTRVHLGDRTFYGMTNIGVTNETHIFNFDEEIYGVPMRIDFLRHIRGEMKFDSLDELAAQLRADEQSCREIIGSLK